jgi:tripartite tricarboxylate transporter family receptor
MGGRAHAVIEGWAGLRGALEGGELKGLAILSAKPSALLPNLPTALVAVPGYTAIGWQVLTLRKGTPEAIVRKIGDDLGKVLADPQLQKRLLDTGPEFERYPLQTSNSSAPSRSTGTRSPRSTRPDIAGADRLLINLAGRSTAGPSH